MTEALKTDADQNRRDAGERLLREGETCWRRLFAGRAAVLVDGEAYFDAVASALENAQESILLVGWDFHSAVRLRRSPEAESPTELVPLLDSLVRRRDSLHAHVLGWDYALLYALEREPLPLFQFGVRTHRRVHFAMDSAHPAGASQHQKIIVVDDAVAFVGGFDLTTHRWDTREHAPDDPRRETPGGERYQPFHDVALCVDGDAAAALGDLARQRWHRATGERLESKAEESGGSDPWPADLQPDFEDVEVGISRTVAAYGGEPEIREVETLYRESIAAARGSIYIENQYLTAGHVIEWLCARLEEPEGPEIMIVGPRENSGWLEETTMGALRDRAMRRLEAADEFGRLRVMHPHVPGLGPNEMLNVHSKVMVVDDRLLRVGSSNLANRSLGLDSECDLSIEAAGDDRVARAIRAVRDDLLAEHLGVSSSELASEIERRGSLLEAVDAASGEGRSLRPIEVEDTRWSSSALDSIGAVDPEHPVPLEELVAHFEGDREVKTPHRVSHRLRTATLISLAFGLPLLWRYSPWGQVVEGEALASYLEILRGSWEGMILAYGIFSFASLLFVPVTALMIAVGLIFDPVAGIAIAWLGGITGSAIGHWAGARLWRDTVRRIAGQRLNELSERLGRRGLVSSMIVRVLPIAPFMVVNLVAGASHVRFRDFVVGSAIGILPGTVALVLTANGLGELMAGSSPGYGWIWSPLAIVAAVGSILMVRRWSSGAIARPDPMAERDGDEG